MTAIIDRTEKIFDGFGLMTGNYASLKRFVIGALIGGVGITIWKPASMFNPDGSAREWSFLSPGKDSTSFPWYFVPIITGFAAGVLI